jgi:very-short-patch-repair endonuclease
MTPYKKRKREIVKDLADNATPAEQMLRRALLSAKIKFVFQRPFTIKALKYRKRRFYVADFYFPQLCTIVEIDGEFHQKQIDKDKFRTSQLISNSKMVRYVLRFHNSDVYKDLPHIVGIILNMRPLRKTKLNKEQKQLHRKINNEIARQNEIEYMVKRDNDTAYYQKREMIEQIKCVKPKFEPKTVLRKKTNGLSKF